MISLFALIFVVYVNGQDIADECQTNPNVPGKFRERCCIMPDLIKRKDDDLVHRTFHDCIGTLKETHPEILPEKFQGLPTAEGAPRPRPPQPYLRGPPPVKFLECVQECIYKTSGLMTPEMKPSLEAIQKVADEFIGEEEKWKPIALEAIKKCTGNTPTVSVDAVCNSGAYQTTVCLGREMFFNCPEGSWINSEDCKAKKALLLKCPTMSPPFGMGHRGGHRKKN